MMQCFRLLYHHLLDVAYKDLFLTSTNVIIGMSVILVFNLTQNMTGKDSCKEGSTEREEEIKTEAGGRDVKIVG